MHDTDENVTEGIVSLSIAALLALNKSIQVSICICQSVCDELNLVFAWVLMVFLLF